jgi:hypothetical protein
MKFSIIKHNKNGNYDDLYDGYLKHHWINTIQQNHEYTSSHEDADFSILPIVWEPDYIYDISINDIKFNNIIVLDFMEYGCGFLQNEFYNSSYFLFGLKFDDISAYFARETQYSTLHLNMSNHLRSKIRVHFKRELSSKLTDLCTLQIPVLPVDYMNSFDEYDIASVDAFYDRGLDTLYIWGRSNQDRVKFHASILYQMDRYGHNMYSSEKQYNMELLQNNRTSAFLLLHAEWYERCDYKKYQFNSRSVIDLYGAGMKCFRNIESTINCTSFKQDPSILQHAYPWIDAENCIYLPNLNDGTNILDIDKSCDVLYEYTRGGSKHKLYDIYLKSCETNLKYKSNTYIYNYFLPNVEKYLK